MWCNFYICTTLLILFWKQILYFLCILYSCKDSKGRFYFVFAHAANAMCKNTFGKSCSGCEYVVKVYICAENTRYPTRRNFFHLLGFGHFCMEVNLVFALHLRPVQCFFEDGKDCVYCRFVHLGKFDVRAWHLTVVYVQRMLWKLTHLQLTMQPLFCMGSN